MVIVNVDKLERGGQVDDEREASFTIGSRDTDKIREMAERTREGSHRYWLLPPGAIRGEHGVTNPIFEEVLSGAR